jgi:hypothetical protein
VPLNSRDIDRALVEYLESDALLQAELPDGVFIGEAPENAKRCIVITLADHEDVAEFGKRAYERVLYLVKTIARSDLLANTYAADGRLDELLEDGVPEVPGFMACYRVRRVREVERDDLDKSKRWFHGGGYYRIEVAVP